MNRAEKIAEAKRQLAARGESPVRGRKELRLAPCTHLGVREGKTCGSPLRRCNLHGDLTVQFGSCVDAQRKCSDCSDYTPFHPIATRHLLYHIYPVAGNGAWQWNVAELRKRLRLFNGMRVVAVAIDPPPGRKPDPDGPHAPDGYRDIRGCDAFDDVVREFGTDAAGIEFIHVENDPALREVVSFLPLFERALEFATATDCFLYAQAKGTTRPPTHVARRWAEVQYEVMMDYWPVIERSLARHPVTGAFKKYGPGWAKSQSVSDWHYSGSWFWCRSRELFKKPNWRKIDAFWSGIEPYPSQHFGRESGCIFLEDRVSKLNLYDRGYWRRVVEPALSRFKEEHAGDATNP